jgi:5-methylcytosine-specific restriction endonuclease McrA
MRLTWPMPGDHAWCEGHPEKLRIVRIILTVAHLDHQPENCAPENLKAWCQRCHNRYDIAERRKGIQERARASRAVNDLFEEPRP